MSGANNIYFDWTPECCSDSGKKSGPDHPPETGGVPSRRPRPKPTRPEQAIVGPNGVEPDERGGFLGA
jgi:hypothetical protein